MSTSSQAAWQSAVPIGPEHVRAAAELSVGNRKVRQILDELEEVMASAFTAMNPAGLKCRLSSATTVSQSREDPSRGLHCFRGQSQTLHIWISGDRRLAYMLCELAFGGSGKGEATLSTGAQMTRVEEKMMNFILGDICNGFAEVLSGIGGSPLERVEMPSPETIEIFTCSHRLLELCFSVSGTEESGEIRFQLVADELKDFFSENPAENPGQTPYGSVKKCKFELLSLLPPDEIPLSVLLALKPGSQLSLSITVDSPIMVVCGNEVVFEGECDPAGDRINIHLRTRDGEPGNMAQHQTSAIEVSGSVH
jgi:flagellar motor switch protein FliM